MNLILLRQQDHWPSASVVELADQRAEHIRTVLRASCGDRLRVGLLGGHQGVALIEAIDSRHVRLKVSLVEAPPPRHRFDLVLALPRPKMLRRILRTVAEFGVSHLHLINSARVEKSYWQSPLLGQERLEEALMAGMERASDTVAPKLHLHPRFRPFIEDQLGSIAAGRPCWITAPGASMALADAPAGDAVVMVGPEGGFVPFELALACLHKARPAHLGQRILSVDTALTTALAQGAINLGCRSTPG